VNQSQRTRRSKKSLSSTASGRAASPACTAVPTALESRDWGVLQEIFLASREQFLRMLSFEIEKTLKARFKMP